MDVQECLGVIKETFMQYFNTYTKLFQCYRATHLSWIQQPSLLVFVEEVVSGLKYIELVLGLIVSSLTCKFPLFVNCD